MRVTNGSMYRKFTSSVNDVHYKLNKSMTKISSGAAYEKAAENPLAYYTGQKIDSQYQDTLAKNTLLTDVKNRLYQQELGARDIQDVLSKAKKQVIYGRTATTTGESDIQTIKEDLVQKVRTVVNDLNTQYQDFYIYGGNDVSTTPFTLDVNLEDESMTMHYFHTFPGESKVTEFQFKLAKDDADGEYHFKFDETATPSDKNYEPGDGDKLVKAMSEQGRIDIGYGSINDKETLVDTYTGGLNILIGLNSDTIRATKKAGDDVEQLIADRLETSSVGLIGKAVLAIQDYQYGDNSGNKDILDDRLKASIDDMTKAEHELSTVYSDLGNKYLLLEDTGKRLDSIEDSLTEQYKDTLGADPYEAIMEMFNNQYAYNAALQVGSKLMTTSLFDFVR